jgi:thiol-disulfide isomerase/thioredoxin
MGSIAALGEPLPDLALAGIDGRLRRAAEARGRVLILNFWSAECPHSARGDGAIAELARMWGREVQVWPIASNWNEDEPRIRAAARERGLPIVLLDRDQSAASLLGAVATPHVFVVDATGELRYRGAVDDVSFGRRTPTRNYLATAVAAVLAGRQPDPAETAPFGCAIVWKKEG